MISPRIGFLTLGHRDYPNDIGERMADQAVEQLTQSEIEVCRASSPALEPWQAVDAARKLLDTRIDGVIVFLDTWLEAPVAIAAIRELEHLPLLVWGFPMFETEGRRESTGSAVVYTVIKGALDRVGLSHEGVWGKVNDPAALNRVLTFARAAHTWKRLQQTRIGLVGYASMGMYSGTFDHLLMRFRIGPEVEHADSYSIIRRAEAIGRKRCDPVVSRLRRRARITEGVTEDHLQTVVRIYLALKDWAAERHLDAICFKCQYEFSQEYGMVGCVPLALLASDGIVTSCEGDIPLMVSMIIQHYLTGQAIAYGDVLDRVGNRLLFSSCGFAPYETASSPDDVEIRPAIPPYFKGVTNSFALKPGKVTYLRLSEEIGNYCLTYGTGTGLPSERREGWAPALTVELDGDADDFLTHVTTQHYSLAYGDLSQEIESLARMLRVEVLRI
jgi:L-fucose isomerase-like protein